MVPGPQLTPALYGKHYPIANRIAKEFGGGWTMRQEARTALWEFCSNFEGGPFVKQAEQFIRERLQAIT